MVVVRRLTRDVVAEGLGFLRDKTRTSSRAHAGPASSFLRATLPPCT